MLELPAGLDAYDLVPPVRPFELPGPGSNNDILGVHTGAGDFVWKTYRTEGDLAAILYEHHLLAWLGQAKLSFGVPVPVPTRGGETVCRTPQGLHVLTRRLPGHQLDVGQLDLVEATGAASGELQRALSGYRASGRPRIPPFGDLDQIHPGVPDPFALSPQRLGLPDAGPYDSLLGWWRDELEALRPFVLGPYRSLPWQVVHRDLDPSNTLTDRGAVTGILDFEFAGEDARALDVAASLKFTMRVWENPAPWDAARAFCRGYRRRSALTQEEVEAIPRLTRLRDAVSIARRIGRALEGGQIQRTVMRIESAQASAQWLRENERQLIDLLAQEIT
jgi:homoserine kinase type II